MFRSSRCTQDDPEDTPAPTTTSRPVTSDGSQPIETRDGSSPDDLNLTPSSSSRLLDALDNLRRTNQEALLEIKGRLLALVDDTQDMKQRNREVQETLVRNGELQQVRCVIPTIFPRSSHRMLRVCSVLPNYLKLRSASVTDTSKN